VDFVNEPFLDIFGIDKMDKVLGKEILPSLFWNHPKERKAFLSSLKKKHTLKCANIKLKSRSGKIIYADIYCITLRDVWGKITGYQGIVVSRTESKKSEDALRESEEKFRTLFEGATNPVTILDRAGKILMINVAGARNLGVSPEACVGKSIFKLIPKLDHSYREIYAGVVDSGVGKNKESLVELPSGPRWFWSIHQPVSDTKRGRYGVQVISYDITERKKAEEELKERAKELEELNARFKDRNLDLEKFRRLTVDRELRMAEIQEENKELKERLKGKGKK
jgi:PAS domain S-box-containing protein